MLRFCDHRILRVLLTIVLLSIFVGCGDPRPDPAIVVFAGDSLTAHWKESWPLLLPGEYRNFINAGIDGNTSVALLQRFGKDVLSQKAHIVHIWIGTNDSADWPTYHSIPLTMTENNIVQMASMARQQGMRAIVGTIPPVMATFPKAAEINDHIRQLNEWIRTYNGPDKWVVTDYYQLLELDDSLNPSLCSDGKVHLNEAGYAAISTALLRAIETP